jgi:DNA-binding NtrC family response regulator
MGPPMLEEAFSESLETAPASLSATARPLSGNSSTAFENVEVFDRDGHLRTLEAIERDLIQLAIDTYDGRMSEVARRLGMGRSTLYRKLRDHGLEVKRAS